MATAAADPSLPRPSQQSSPSSQQPSSLSRQLSPPPPNLLTSLRTLYDSSRRLDLTISTDTQEVVRCHAIVAAGNSYYIADALKGAALHSPDGSTYYVLVPETSIDVLNAVVEYFYSGNARLTLLNVCEMLKVAQILNMETLSAECDEYIAESLTMETFQQFQTFANNNKVPSLDAACERFLKQHREDFLTSGSIVHVSLEMLHEYLDVEPSTAQREDLLLSCVMKWLKHQCSGDGGGQLKRTAKQLLEKIQVENCSSETLLEVLADVADYEDLEVVTHRVCLKQILIRNTSDQASSCGKRPQTTDQTSPANRSQRRAPKPQRMAIPENVRQELRNGMRRGPDRRADERPNSGPDNRLRNRCEQVIGVTFTVKQLTFCIVCARHQ